MGQLNRSRIVADLRRVTHREIRHAIPRKGVITPTAQVEGFLRGEGQWRLAAGLITPEEYQRYQDAMRKKLQERLEQIQRIV